MTKGVLFIGHGTRRRHGVEEFVAFYEAVKTKLETRADLGLTLKYAFLELQEPSIGTSLKEFVESGVHHVVAIPLFLFQAGHMKDDIPRELARAQDRHPDLTVQLDTVFGNDDVMQVVVRDRLRELGALRDDSMSALSGDLLLLGRGNKDETAQRAFYEVADGVRKALSLPRVFVGFLAGTGPSLEHALTQAYECKSRRVIVFPFLWFSGLLTDTLAARIQPWIALHSDTQIQIAPHLGLHESLIDHVANRILSAHSGYPN